MSELPTNESQDPSSNEVDNERMIELSKGDDLALSRIMDRWQAPVISYLYRTTGNYETAKDLAQEVFVRLYRNRRRYRPGGNFSSYIFTIATNLAKNHFRWRARHPEVQLEEGPEVQLVGEVGDGTAQIDPSSYIEKVEDGGQIRIAVLALPEKLRFPIILFYYHDMTQVQIAEILNCSEKAVETRLYRARKSLRSVLSGLSRD